MALSSANYIATPLPTFSVGGRWRAVESKGGVVINPLEKTGDLCCDLVCSRFVLDFLADSRISPTPRASRLRPKLSLESSVPNSRRDKCCESTNGCSRNTLSSRRPCRQVSCFLQEIALINFATIRRVLDGRR